MPSRRLRRKSGRDQRAGADSPAPRAAPEHGDSRRLRPSLGNVPGHGLSALYAGTIAAAAHLLRVGNGPDAILDRAAGIYTCRPRLFGTAYVGLNQYSQGHHSARHQPIRRDRRACLPLLPAAEVRHFGPRDGRLGSRQFFRRHQSHSAAAISAFTPMPILLPPASA